MVDSSTSNHLQTNFNQMGSDAFQPNAGLDDEVVLLLDDMMTDYVDYPNLLAEDSFTASSFPTLQIQDWSTG